MKIDAITSPNWSTASFGRDADTSPMELAALGEHLHHCRGSRGSLFALRCLAERMNGFVVSRFVTTLAVATVVIGVCAAVL
ncbi:hypothetical protein RD110_25525 [Rhodoferax koreense]|uniref:Uncharacterized protein n=1 Tax=Rhodoferax koreensis TaxID=1842727 RepID=A0A1P8K2D3_9BURK|nr:hypothetical protein [Rhodoferax koreense]APW40149.1 hypothetical protein RD110_25525 [Rhodoferax koreense]